MNADIITFGNHKKENMKQCATEEQIRNMKVGDVFLHPTHYSGYDTSTFFKISEIGEDSARFGKFNKIMKGERWDCTQTGFAPPIFKFVENESIWASELTGSSMSKEFADTVAS